MKKLLILLFIPGMAFATHLQINCATTNITTSYATTSGLVITQIPNGNAHIAILNPSATRICVYSESYTATPAPSTPQLNEHCAQPSSIMAWDFVTTNGNIFVRADGASCTSATVDVDSWAN